MDGSAGRRTSQDELTSWAKLNNELDQVVRCCSPTELDRASRLSLINRVQNAVSQSSAMRAVQIIPYGSFISGIYNNSSDLDLAVSGMYSWNHLDKRSQREWLEAGNPSVPWIELCKLDSHTKQTVLRKAINKLMENSITDKRTVVYILHARVPIIKFKDISTGIECDLSVGGDGQELKAQTFSLMAQVNPCFHSLLILIKQWAKAHGINDGTSGLFNSHCLALLVVFYLQQCNPPALPPMYRLFYSQRPPAEAERILQGQDTAAKAEMARRMAASRVMHAQDEYQGRHQPLADMMLGFVGFFQKVLERALMGPQEQLRLSCWWGEVIEQAGPSEYVLVVEEPMNSEDNPARTFGKKNQFCWNLHYVADLVKRTHEVLQAVKDSKVSSIVGLLFLLGPCAPIQGPPKTTLSSLVGSDWCHWFSQMLRPDRSNAGDVLYQVLEHLHAPADEWMPVHCRDGPTGYKQCAMAMGKSRAKQRHQQQPQADVSTVASASNESLDKVVAARSAAGLVGYQAALAVATELEYRKQLRDQARRLRDEAKKQKDKEEQEKARVRERERVALARAASAASSGAGGGQGAEDYPSRQSSGNHSGSASRLEVEEEAHVARHLVSLAIHRAVSQDTTVGRAAQGLPDNGKHHEKSESGFAANGQSVNGGLRGKGRAARGQQQPYAPKVMGRGAVQGTPGPGDGDGGGALPMRSGMDIPSGKAGPRSGGVVGSAPAASSAVRPPQPRSDVSAKGTMGGVGSAEAQGVQGARVSGPWSHVELTAGSSQTGSVYSDGLSRSGGGGSGYSGSGCLEEDGNDGSGGGDQGGGAGGEGGRAKSKKQFRSKQGPHHPRENSGQLGGSDAGAGFGGGSVVSGSAGPLGQAQRSTSTPIMMAPAGQG